VSRGTALAALAREHAKNVVHAHVPTGTLPYDDVTLTRQALENLLALAFANGIQIGYDRGCDVVRAMGNDRMDGDS